MDADTLAPAGKAPPVAMCQRRRVLALLGVWGGTASGSVTIMGSFTETRANLSQPGGRGRAWCTGSAGSAEGQASFPCVPESSGPV